MRLDKRLCTLLGVAERERGGQQFGDAELASLVAPRTLIVEAAKGPEFVIPPGTGGGPGRLSTPKLEAVRKEIERARKLVEGLSPAPRIELVVSGGGEGPFGTAQTLQAFLESINPEAKLVSTGPPPKRVTLEDTPAWAFSEAVSAPLFSVAGCPPGVPASWAVVPLPSPRLHWLTGGVPPWTKNLYAVTGPRLPARSTR